MAEPSPGQIITPGNNQEEPAKQPVASAQEASVNINQQQPVTPAPTPPSPPPAPQPIEATPYSQPPTQPQASLSQQPQSAPISPSPEPTQAEQSSEQKVAQGGFAPQFQLEETQAFDQPEANTDTISWTASEYIAHQKSAGWYLALGVTTIGLSVLVYFITHDILSSVVIVLVAIVFGIYAGKTPKEQQYSIGRTGISIGAKTYGFDQLRTFAIVEEGAFSSIIFLPMKRFMPIISIYYDPKDEEKIISILSNYLPMDTQKRDLVDNLMRKIRF